MEGKYAIEQTISTSDLMSVGKTLVLFCAGILYRFYTVYEQINVEI